MLYLFEINFKEKIFIPMEKDGKKLTKNEAIEAAENELSEYLQDCIKFKNFRAFELKMK